MNKLWFAGGITAAFAVVVLGVSIASAYNGPEGKVAPKNTTVANKTCACGQAGQCQGKGQGQKGTCGCADKKGSGGCSNSGCQRNK